MCYNNYYIIILRIQFTIYLIHWWSYLLCVYIYKWKNHFFKMKRGYRDGVKHQKGRNKGSLHSKDAQSYMTPSLYLCLILIKQDIGMVSCSFVHLCCVMTPCFFLFGASRHPYIPFSFWRNDFSTCIYTHTTDMIISVLDRWWTVSIIILYT